MRYQIKPSTKQCRMNSERGVSLLEYAIVVIVLGFVVLGVYQQFQPKSSAFYSDVASGFNVVYPTGYWSS